MSLIVHIIWENKLDIILQHFISDFNVIFFQPLIRHTYDAQLEKLGSIRHSLSKRIFRFFPCGRDIFIFAILIYPHSVLRCLTKFEHSHVVLDLAPEEILCMSRSSKKVRFLFGGLLHHIPTSAFENFSPEA